MAGVDDVAVTGGEGRGAPQPLPLLGKKAATPPRKSQSNSARRPVVTPKRTISVTRSGKRSA